MKIRLSKKASKTLAALPVKHARQIAQKIHRLSENIGNVEYIELKGYTPWKRVKSGEYRIIFSIDQDELLIGLIGKRNDDEIYRLASRFLK